MDQSALWANVNTIKRRVHMAIGADLSHEFRSSQLYQAYTGLCGEAQMAYEEADLDERLVGLLEECADNVIASYQQL